MIEYITSVDLLKPEQLTGFFVGWQSPIKPERHLEILQNSYRVILAMETDTDQVVGFIYAISDGILAAYIPLLEVLPEYQQQGIGSELVRRLIKELDHLYMIDLVCDANVEEFYHKLNMIKASGMMIRNYQQSS